MSERDYESEYWEVCKYKQQGAEKVLNALNWPSCWTCRFRVVEEDWSVGIPAHIADCGCLAVTEEKWEKLQQQYTDGMDEEEMADECGHWSLDAGVFKEL